MKNEEIITEYNENQEPPIITDSEDQENNENFNQEEKIFQKSNVRVTITELKGNETIQNDFI